jgi:hypothetical protein
MKRSLPWLLLLCAGLPACVLFQRPPRPAHASPQEAASFAWPTMLPTEGRQVLSGPMLAAIQLAMEDFLPWDLKSQAGATPRELCLDRRDSYDVVAVPGAEGLIYVEILLRPEACPMDGEVLLDAGGIYAIDTRNWRILSARR